MPEINISTANEKMAELNDMPVPDKQELPFELLEKQSNKTTQLAAAASAMPIDGKYRWYDYEFSESVFLLEIVIETEDYGLGEQFELRYDTGEGYDPPLKLRRGEGNIYQISINRLVSAISFRPPSKGGLRGFISRPKINRVKLYGIPNSEISDVLDALGNMRSHKSEIVNVCREAIENADAKNAEIKSLEERISELEDSEEHKTKTIAESEQSIEHLKDEISSKKDDLTNVQTHVRNTESHLSDLDKNVEAKKDERSGVLKNIEKLREIQKSLQDDINLFPTEISGFVNQGAKNISTYLWLACVPTLLLVIMAIALFLNASNLTTIFNETDDVRIWSILVTRIPYVVIVTAIIAASYKLLQFCISEVIRINQQRLNLSKINIIAREVSLASEVGLDLSEEEQYHLRNRLKMELLKDHLKGYLSRDYSYQLQAEKQVPLEVDGEPVDTGELEEESEPSS